MQVIRECDGSLQFWEAARGCKQMRACDPNLFTSIIIVSYANKADKTSGRAKETQSGHSEYMSREICTLKQSFFILDNTRDFSVLFVMLLAFLKVISLTFLAGPAAFAEPEHTAAATSTEQEHNVHNRDWSTTSYSGPDR